MGKEQDPETASNSITMEDSLASIKSENLEGIAEHHVDESAPAHIAENESSQPSGNPMAHVESATVGLEERKDGQGTNVANENQNTNGGGPQQNDSDQPNSDEKANEPIHEEELSYEEIYEEEIIEEEDEEYYVEEEYIDDDDELYDEESDFTEVTIESDIEEGGPDNGGAETTSAILSGLNDGMFGEDDENNDTILPSSNASVSGRSRTSRASRTSRTSRASQGSIRRRVRFSNKDTKKAEEDMAKHAKEEESARMAREALLEKQRQLEEELEAVRKQREIEERDKREKEGEMERWRKEAEQREAERKAFEAAEMIRQKEAEERRRLEEEEAQRKAKEEEERRMAAEEAAKKLVKEEQARRRAAEEALAKAAEEKRKMEEAIKRIEMELETSRKAKEEAAQRHEQENDKLKEKIENKQKKAMANLERVTEKMNLDQQARKVDSKEAAQASEENEVPGEQMTAQVQTQVESSGAEPRTEPMAEVMEVKVSVTEKDATPDSRAVKPPATAASSAPSDLAGDREDSKSIGQPTPVKKEPAPTSTTAAAAPKTRRVVRRISKLTGEVISTTAVGESASNKKVVRKVVKRVAKKPDVPTSISAKKDCESKTVSPLRKPRTFATEKNTAPPAPPAPTLDDAATPKPASSVTQTKSVPKTKRTMPLNISAPNTAVTSKPLSVETAAPKPVSTPPPVPSATVVANTPAEYDAVGGGQSYSLTQLQKMSVPGLEYTAREKYLTADDFAKVFSCSYDEYRKWPKWRQTKAKRAAKLF